MIASDGIWEFISNEECVRMVAPYWSANDPEGACNILHKWAVENWQWEDEVIDDITCIVLFLKVPSE